MTKTPSILGTLDDYLTRLTDDSPQYYEIGRDMISAIPMNGHPTGYFMTKAILKDSEKEELIRTFNNPFAFFYLYNTAAIKDTSLPRLSNGAILGLLELEKKYISQPETQLAASALVAGIDLSAVEYFRKITTMLEQDKDPESDLWDAFFRNPGYCTLFKHEPNFSREKISDMIALVFKPSRTADLKRALEEGGSYSLDNFVRHKKDMASVLSAVERLRDSRLFRNKIAQVSTLLPQILKEDIFPPSLSFVYFNGDLRYGYPVMVVDPILLVDSPDSFLYFINAYLIWAYADRASTFLEVNLTQKQYAFINGLDEIQRFGLCDLLAFENGLIKKMKIYPRYEKGLSDVPQLIKEIDNIFVRAVGEPEVWKEFSVVVNKFFTRPGCPPGYLMCRAIEEILGRTALAECTGNPLAFIRLYQKSALKEDNLPTFSAESMKFLLSLESECFSKSR